MSFGINDRDWVEPEERGPVRCGECPSWHRCPCGCGHGWCEEQEEFTGEDETCQ